jgi:thiosulfate/3-mercaptopyruvate sulfurtransferase
MPGARSLPFTDLVENGGLKSRDDILEVFGAAGVDPNQRVTASCGSGVTAAVIALAMGRIGLSSAAVYDGSWSEWGSRADTPIVTGPA